MTPFQAPNGLDAIKAMFGNINTYIREDGTISPNWEMNYMVSQPIAFAMPLSWDKSVLVSKIRVHKLAADGRQVLVVGQLMFDTRHLPNPKRGTNHESPRVSTWEIHPTTKFLVCQRPDNNCDPSHDQEWQALESMPDR